jgi:hypothetical protein
MSRGLVLGAGAHAGYAWVSGLIIGLRRAGVDLADADVLVGTSTTAFAAAMTALAASGEEMERMDGTAYSFSNADLAAGLDRVLVLMPLRPLLSDTALDRERRRTHSAGLAASGGGCSGTGGRGVGWTRTSSLSGPGWPGSSRRGS